MKNIILSLFVIVLIINNLYSQGVSGTYSTSFNDMTLHQAGTKVNGTYQYKDGRIEGTLTGHTLTGWWYQSNGKGRIRFEFNADFSAFTGKWSYNDAEPNSEWNGTLKNREKGKRQHVNETGSVSGTYETDFNVMTLRQNGNTVTGTYQYKDGRIEGSLSGHTLTGWWYQSNGKGRIRFEFNSDYSAFSGKWSYNDAEPSSKWNGTKK